MTKIRSLMAHLKERPFEKPAQPDFFSSLFSRTGMPSAKAHSQSGSFSRSAEALLPPHKWGGCHQDSPTLLRNSCTGSAGGTTAAPPPLKLTLVYDALLSSGWTLRRGVGCGFRIGRRGLRLVLH